MTFSLVFLVPLVTRLPPAFSFQRFFFFSPPLPTSLFFRAYTRPMRSPFWKESVLIFDAYLRRRCFFSSFASLSVPLQLLGLRSRAFLVYVATTPCSSLFVHPTLDYSPLFRLFAALVIVSWQNRRLSRSVRFSRKNYTRLFISRHLQPSVFWPDFSTIQLKAARPVSSPHLQLLAATTTPPPYFYLILR